MISPGGNHCRFLWVNQRKNERFFKYPCNVWEVPSKNTTERERERDEGSHRE